MRLDTVCDIAIVVARAGNMCARHEWQGRGQLEAVREFFFVAHVLGLYPVSVTYERSMTHSETCVHAQQSICMCVRVYACVRVHS